MKRIIYLTILLLFCGISVGFAQKTIKKQNLKVLYVGGVSDMYPDSYNGDTIAMKADVQKRISAFETMLKQYFTTVKAIKAIDYNQSMSKDYDVTIIDGTPHSIRPAFTDRTKGLYGNASYLSEDFDLPMITIGRASQTIGRSIGTKNDWYCLCLDAEAHSWRPEHPIFHGPFDVKMTVVEKPTPKEAFHYEYFLGKPTPKTLPMWRVQTKGYEDTEGFGIGMVSRPWGYEDSPEAEYISSGVCAKTLDAVALGRHGNFFHWGFSASPLYMTEEAKAVFANAVVYISKFKGKGIIARKYDERQATLEYVKEMKYYASDEAYVASLKLSKEFNDQYLEKKKEVQEKKAAGKKLNSTDEMVLSFTPIPDMTREQFAKKHMKEWYEKFGLDYKAFWKYLDDNYSYLYGGEGFYQIKIDEDAKSLKIGNHDLKLIDTAISLLEKGTDVEKARRILLRYTLCNFATANEWRNWYNKYAKKLFFSESAGWVWLVNTNEKGVNDYHPWLMRKTLNEVPTAETSNDDPVAIAADRKLTEDGQQVLVIKLKIHSGYHIYEFVPEGSAFFVTKFNVKLPEGYKALSSLKQPIGKAFDNTGIRVYEDEVTLSQIIEGSSTTPIECEVEYQCCDDNICFPPTTKTVKLK